MLRCALPHGGAGRGSPTTIAFVLSGGGSRGDFEVGALKYLYETGLRPDIICGTSVGSLNAAKLAEGGNAIAGLEQTWRGIRGNSDIYADSPGYADLKNSGSGLAGILGESAAGSLMGSSIGGLMGIPWLTGALGGIGGLYVGGQSELSKLANEQSLYVLDPVRQNIVDPQLDLQKVRGSGIRLRLVAVSLETGETVYISEAGVLTGKGVRISENGESVEVARTPMSVSLADAVVASCAIPIIFRPIPMGDEHFVDGGVRQVAPTQALLDMIGDAQGDLPGDVKAFVVVASPIGLRSWSMQPDPNAQDTMDKIELLRITKQTLETLVDEVYVRDIKTLEERARRNGAEVHTILPFTELHDSLTFDPEYIPINIGYGYNRAADVLLKVGQPYSGFTENLLQIDRDLYSRARGSAMQGLRMAELIAGAYQYWKDPSSYSDSHRTSDGLVWWDNPPVDDVKFALGEVASVEGYIGSRRRAGLPATSYAWELISQYDWPYARLEHVPRISLSTPSIAFGNVALCFSGAQPLNIQNSGEALLVVRSLAIGTGDFSVSSPAPFTIPPGQSANLGVMFKPTVERPETATLAIQSDDPSQGMVNVQLTGTGFSSPPSASIPEELDFGYVVPGKTRALAIDVENLGSQTLNITRLASSDSSFGVLKSPGPIGCSKGDSIWIEFRPPLRLQQDYSATITIDSNDPSTPAAVSLLGTTIPQREPPSPPPGHLPRS